MKNKVLYSLRPDWMDQAALSDKLAFLCCGNSNELCIRKMNLHQIMTKLKPKLISAEANFQACCSASCVMRIVFELC